jgi:flavodoxin
LYEKNQSEYASDEEDKGWQRLEQLEAEEDVLEIQQRMHNEALQLEDTSSEVVIGGEDEGGGEAEEEEEENTRNGTQKQLKSKPLGPEKNGADDGGSREMSELEKSLQLSNPPGFEEGNAFAQYEQVKQEIQEVKSKLNNNNKLPSKK